MAAKPKIGIAFGGGGIRGLAHIGIMQVLQKAGIKADVVSGTSIGSAIAALYAAGNDADELARIIPKLDFKSIFGVKFSRKGFIDGAAYAEVIKLLTHNQKIEDLPVQLKIVAVDLISGQKVIFDHGSIAKAVQASSAIPGVFIPVDHDGKMLVDGFILDNCPDRILREAGADIVIAIDLDYENDNDDPHHVIDIMNRTLDIMSRAQVIADSDFILKPITENIGSLEFAKADLCLAMGRLEAENKLKKIQDLISNWSANELGQKQE